MQVKIHMTSFLVLFIRILSQVLFLIVVAEVVTSYFLPPYHPVRAFLLKILEPMLTPIRKLVKPVGSLDFSPFVLMILIQIAEVLLVSLVAGFG